MSAPYAVDLKDILPRSRPPDLTPGGVDLNVIRELLKRTPTERLRLADLRRQRYLAAEREACLLGAAAQAAHCDRVLGLRPLVPWRCKCDQ